MFIYKISVNNKDYYGMDTHSEHKEKRWKSHLSEAFENMSDLKVHVAMREAGLDNCKFTVVESGFNSIQELALAEIRYINEHNTYRNGLNSSLGGDGLGYDFMWSLSDSEINEIKNALSKSMSDYNRYIKWAKTSENDRKQMTSHLHNAIIYQKKSESLKNFYKQNPEIKESKKKILAEWREKNRDKLLEQNRNAAMIGAAKVSKKVKVEFEDGRIEIFNSKSEYAKKYNNSLKYIIEKTKNGSHHKNRRAWEI